LNAYLEEELYDLITFCIQNPNSSDLGLKKKRIQEIGKELYADGGVDAMENIFYPIEFRIKEEIGKDAKFYRSWWNNISEEWIY
jgi:thermostable 8-oxoguanine DNA glycosylase